MARSRPHTFRCMLIVLCTALLVAVPVHAFTANSLDITVGKNGDATAVFRFTLEGLLENAIPQSVLEEQLVKGLATSNEPPTLVSMDRSSATIIMKKFANTYNTATGTDYQTSSMDFKKAEIALQNSAVSSVVTADFSPSTVIVTFPDGYSRTFTDADALPSLTHSIADPSKPQPALAADAGKGTINVTASPAGTGVYLDGTYLGDAPSVFSGIAPGVHTISFQKGGYSPVSRNVTVAAGRTVRVTVFLNPAPVTTRASAPPLGGLAAVISIAAAGLVLACFRRQK